MQSCSEGSWVPTTVLMPTGLQRHKGLTLFLCLAVVGVCTQIGPCSCRVGTGATSVAWHSSSQLFAVHLSSALEQPPAGHEMRESGGHFQARSLKVLWVMVVMIMLSPRCRGPGRDVVPPCAAAIHGGFSWLRWLVRFLLAMLWIFTWNGSYLCFQGVCCLLLVMCFVIGFKGLVAERFQLTILREWLTRRSAVAARPGTTWESPPPPPPWRRILPWM